MKQSPKERFLEQKEFVKQQLDITASSAFIAASDAAMLQLLAELTPNVNAEASAQAFQFVMGARRYAQLLSSIAEAPMPAPPRGRGDNLNH